MDIEELAQELIAFLNATGQYHNFLDWEEEREYDRDQLEDDMLKVEESQ